MNVLSSPSVREILSRANIELAILFGSAAAHPPRLRPDSDIDIGVFYAGEDAGRAAALAEIEVSLSRVLKREVDLVDLAEASTLLRFEAARGQRLYERRPGTFGDFAARAALEYDDLRPILLRCGWGMMRRLAEAR